MAESSYTIDDLHAIQRAIASGELSVAFKDRTVTYRSIPELRMAEDAIIRALEPSSRRPMLQRASFDNDMR